MSSEKANFPVGYMAATIATGALSIAAASGAYMNWGENQSYSEHLAQSGFTLDNIDSASIANDKLNSASHHLDYTPPGCTPLFEGFVVAICRDEKFPDPQAAINDLNIAKIELSNIGDIEVVDVVNKVSDTIQIGIANPNVSYDQITDDIFESEQSRLNSVKPYLDEKIEYAKFIKKDAKIQANDLDAGYTLGFASAFAMSLGIWSAVCAKVDYDKWRNDGGKFNKKVKKAIQLVAKHQ